MRIAFDSGALYQGHAVRGIGVMVQEQIRALEKEAKKRKGVRFKSMSFEGKDLSDYDVIHYPYFFPYSCTLPKEKKAKKIVVTIQDLIHMVYPKVYPPGIKGRINLLKQKKRLELTDAVITISETSKKDIVRFLGIDEKKVHVVYLAPKPIFKTLAKEKLIKTKKKYKLPERFVLYVGDINYNKNLPSLIKACSTAKINLVIVGKQALDIEDLGIELPVISGPKDWIRYVFNIPHPELVHYKELLREFSPNKNIIRTGFVTESELVAIYNMATVYCQPSYYEGFGLPVLEAMACGTAVIASKTQALVEIADGACVFVDPNDPKDISRAILSVIKSPKLRDDLIKKGALKARQYSWEKTGRGIMDVYEKVLY